MRLFTLLVLAVLLPACSGPGQCQSTCQGCCSESGVCLAGSTDSQCGRLGDACSVCTGVRACSSGICRTVTADGGGSGGGGAVGGGGGAVGGGGGAVGGGGGGGRPDGGTPDAGAVDAGRRSADARVFVTSALFTGDLLTAGGGGQAVAAGDRLCAGAAADAGLTGTWRAFIAVTPQSAIDRHNDGAPYWLVGTAIEVFRTPSKLARRPEAPLNRSEFGVVVPPSQVWTGTDRTGTNDGVSCEDWSSGVAPHLGSVGLTFDAGVWVGAFAVICDQSARLYCFEY